MKLIESTVKAICDIIAMVIVTVFLMVIAIGLTLFCTEIKTLIDMEFDFEAYYEIITEYSLEDAVKLLQMRLKSDIPFNDVIDASFENIGTVFQIFTGFKDDSVITKEQMTESLIMGVIKTCIANLFIFFFTKINYWIRFRNPLLNIFSNGIRLPFYALAGFAMAGALINIIDIFILGELKFACSALVAILCFLLHLKGMKKKLKNFMMSKIFGFMIKNIIFSVINSIFVWIICTELDGLYDESKTMALVIACFIFAFILLAEDWILYRSPFKKIRK